MLIYDQWPRRPLCSSSGHACSNNDDDHLTCAYALIQHKLCSPMINGHSPCPLSSKLEYGEYLKLFCRIIDWSVLTNDPCAKCRLQILPIFQCWWPKDRDIWSGMYAARSHIKMLINDALCLSNMKSTMLIMINVKRPMVEQRLNSIWSHCLYLCCQDHHAVIKWIMLIAANGCDEHGNWVMFDVQAELAELQRKLDLLWTSELLNFWTPPSRLFIPPAHFWIAPQNCSAILWFCLSTVLRVYLMLYPHSHKSYNATCEPSMHKNAPPCDFLSCLNNPMLWWKWL